jgi:hypothetical protein
MYVHFILSCAHHLTSGISGILYIRVCQKSRIHIPISTYLSIYLSIHPSSIHPFIIYLSGKDEGQKERGGREREKGGRREERERERERERENFIFRNWLMRL